MFTKVLIANRGEIACRAIETCKRMGISTVAVYSDADARALHVRLADEAMPLGPAPPRASYLSGDKILAAARATGAEAIHPGYGFLSENAGFASACLREGVVFIGPPPEAIAAMGSKSAAKQLMERAGIPLLPGYHGANQDAAFLRKEAMAIGYPLLIKASAGGGGKGMRIVRSDADFADALASCGREAASSFGDGRVLLEKYLLRPRHIEIQIFADNHGNAVSLFERDCSVQRRHQKVLEEAPAPGMTAGRRSAMSQAALDAARATAYVGAGTVEFIVSQDGAFYFMEMNTRLQVEHPVTEMIAGVDLVEWQLRVAAGERLPLSREELRIAGHAIEARIYAEDPDKGFLPSPGTLIHLVPPRETAHVRVDTGVEEGDAIAPDYDPMIAKLVVWDEDRERARARMLKALGEYQIAGVANNVEFLARLVACPSFASADLDTGLIERESDYLFARSDAPPREAFALAALWELLCEARRAEKESGAGDRSPWNARDGWRLNSSLTRVLNFRAGTGEKPVRVTYSGRSYLLEIDGVTLAARGELCGASPPSRPQKTVAAELDGWRLTATIVASGDVRQVFFDRRRYRISYLGPPRGAGGEIAPEGRLTAPMPGRIIALLAEPGQAIAKGTPLLILEAMKMEHTIVSPMSGTLKAFRHGAGDQVVEGCELIEIGD